MRWTFTAIAIAAVLLVPTAAVAASTSWQGLSNGLFQRPTEDLTALAPGPPVFYSSLSIFVDTSGVYEVSSVFDFFNEPFDGMVFVYAESFDPTQPLSHLIAGDDDGPEPNSAKLSILLTAGVIYQVVHAAKDPMHPVGFRATMEGPGQVRFSGCFLGDEPDLSDDGSEISLLVGHPIETTGRFCIGVSWRDFAGRTGLARPVGHRSDSSAMFWFFSPDNWELSLKVLDGCAVNGHYWVLFSGSTNVELHVVVFDIQRGGISIHRRYDNPLGHPAGTVLDTSAFACDGLGD